MAYFKNHYSSIRLPFVDGTSPGLRRAQLGAIHALASHFTLSRNEPALVTMPTGSGKTAVLMTAAFMRRSRRTLVVTPSALVRNQIATEFKSLSLLKALGVTGDIAPPEVIEVKHRCASPADWLNLAAADVVVATPQTVSPGHSKVSEPPDWLFDLILVDEAHHEPAHTWRTLLDAFPSASKALFTATPYREDGREIKGRFVYVYTLREAMNDQIFSQVHFTPVLPATGQTSDEAIAKKAEEVLRADQAAGFEHHLIVRTDQKTRAESLVETYKKVTGLRLTVVHSGHSFKRVEDAVKQLRSGELDGLICVDMFGEGFDFPQLKIAAIHSPHRSLSVTLQFIGRFTRVGGPKTGGAKFIAVPSEVRGETAALFTEDAVWGDLIVGLSEDKVAHEQYVRDVIGEFEDPTVTSADADDVSLYSLVPACHAKIYRVNGEVDLQAPIALPAGFEIIHRQENQVQSTCLFITKETEQPRWSSAGQFARAEYDLFVIYHHKDAELLFICASRRSMSIYETIAVSLTGGAHGILALDEVNRVLSGLQAPAFYNIGMRNRMQSSRRESYRIIAGSSAQNALSRTDGRMFHRGHVSCRGMENGKPVTIGYSSASKVWSSQNVQVPDLLDWFRVLGLKIANASPQHTGSNLDFLPVGRRVTEIPAPIIAAEWHPDFLFEERMLSVVNSNELVHCQDMVISARASDRAGASGCRLDLESPVGTWGLTFRLDEHPLFRAAGGWEAEVLLTSTRESSRLIDVINNLHPTFYLADGSSLQGSYHMPFNEQFDPLDPKLIHTWDWNGIDIRSEYQDGEECMYSAYSPSSTGAAAAAAAAPQSIQGATARWVLLQSGTGIIFYDHSTGEAADFLAFRETENAIVVAVFHCKGSSEASAGCRVEDAYDVCGQAIKCVRIVGSQSSLLDHIRRRSGKQRSRFLRGDVTSLEALLNNRLKRMEIEIYIVQPGISSARLSGPVSTVLAAANEYVLRELGASVQVICSP